MMMSLGPISISKQASAHFPTIQPVTPMPSTRMSLLSMFQQQYTGVVQRDKTEGRATDSLAIVLWRSTIAAVELSQSDHGPATSASSIVLAIGSISFSLWARFSDGALRGQHDKPYNRFRPDQQAGLFAGDRNFVSGRILLQPTCDFTLTHRRAAHDQPAGLGQRLRAQRQD
jgi:hypothetical protein